MANENQKLHGDAEIGKGAENTALLGLSPSGIPPLPPTIKWLEERASAYLERAGLKRYSHFWSKHLVAFVREVTR